MDCTTSLTMRHRLNALLADLEDPQYRQAYIEGHAKDTIAFQLRRMRISRGWEQKDVAARLGNPKLQPMVSRYENPDYGKYSVASLIELAKAFDVALVVRFAPLNELVRWDMHKAEATLNPAPYADDRALQAMNSEDWMWRKEARTGNYAPVIGIMSTPRPFELVWRAESPRGASLVRHANTATKQVA